MSGFSYIKTKCIVCGLPRDNTFWDKSGSRPLCSKQCYYDWFDTLPHKSVINDCFNTKHKTVNTFYRQGRLTGLQDFNLSRSW